MKLHVTLAALFIGGVLLASAFHSAPRFRDPAWQNKVPFGNSEAFFSAQEENRTLRGQLAEFGAGLASLALSLAVGAVALGVRSWSAVRTIATPSRKWAIVVVANLTFLGLLYCEWLGLLRDLERGEYPGWADTPAIPLIGFVFAGYVGVPVVTVGLVGCLWRARLPASLWLWPVGWWPWFSTVVIGLLLAFEALSFVGSVQFGNALAVPFHVTVMYWLLCGRAAASSRHAA